MYTLMSNVCIVCIVFFGNNPIYGFQTNKIFLISTGTPTFCKIKDLQVLKGPIKDEGFFFLNQYILLNFHQILTKYSM